jgi:hypothetical protein
MRKLRALLVTAALTGTVLVTTSTPAHAYWIYHWSGPYSAQEGCLADRQAFIEQETEAGQMFTVGPCGYHERNPETGFGPAGWFYRWGIFAA